MIYRVVDEDGHEVAVGETAESSGQHVLLARVNGRVSAEEVERVSAVLNTSLPHWTIVVYDDSMSLEVY